VKRRRSLGYELRTCHAEPGKLDALLARFRDSSSLNAWQQARSGSIKTLLDKARNASLVTYITSDDAPFFIAHGTADPLVPYNQTETFAAALEISKVPVYVETIEDGGRGGFDGPKLNARLQALFDKPDVSRKALDDAIRYFDQMDDVAHDPGWIAWRKGMAARIIELNANTGTQKH